MFLNEAGKTRNLLTADLHGFARIRSVLLTWKSFAKSKGLPIYYAAFADNPEMKAKSYTAEKRRLTRRDAASTLASLACAFIYEGLHKRLGLVSRSREKAGEDAGAPRSSMSR